MWHSSEVMSNHAKLHEWPVASIEALPCVKCGDRPKIFLIEAGFNWLGCPCTLTPPIGGSVDESYNNWKEINR